MTFIPNGLPLIYNQNTVKTGDTLSATTTALQFYASNYTIPANSMQVGQTFETFGFGSFVVSAATAPTVVAGLYFNSVGAVVTPAVSNPAGANGLGFTALCSGSVLSTGTSGTVRFGGVLNFALTGTTGISVIVPPTTVTVNTTIAQTLQYGATFSSVVSGNSVSFGVIKFYSGTPAASSN